MRIITGSLKGREFKSPQGHKTRPMSDKIRGALFNALGDIEDLTILDAFAGSGAVAFEAASRGAGQIISIDIDKSAHKAMAESVEQLKLEDRVRIIRANASGWSDNNPDMQFDIVVLDPPYNNIQPRLLQKLADRHVKPGGLAILSLPPKTSFSLADSSSSSYRLLSAKTYGDACLDFYRRLK